MSSNTISIVTKTQTDSYIRFWLFIIIIIIFIIYIGFYYYNKLDSTSPTISTTSPTISPTTIPPTVYHPIIPPTVYHPIIKYPPPIKYTFPTNEPSAIYTAPPSSSVSQKFEGTWISYKYGGIEFGPVTIILLKGENNFYILGKNVPSDMRLLTVDPNTFLCSLKYNSNFGIALIYEGKAIKILGYNGTIYLERSNDNPILTAPPTSTDRFEGTWFSFNLRRKEYGPVTILSLGNNSYYISGRDVPLDTRLLTINPDSLSCSLPQKMINSFGIASIINGKAISIDGNQDITFKRFAPVPTQIPTVSPTSTDPFEGIWASYKYSGNEYGPVTIISTESNSYYIYGGNVPDTDRRVLTVDPNTLLCSLKYNSNFGKAFIYGGTALKIFGNKGITFNRSNELPTVSPTTTDRFEGTWRSFNYAGREYGPVSIISTGGSEYYIYGNNVDSETLRVLTIDPDTLSASLPNHNGMYNFGTAKIVNGKAISITGPEHITFIRQ